MNNVAQLRQNLSHVSSGSIGVLSSSIGPNNYLNFVNGRLDDVLSRIKEIEEDIENENLNERVIKFEDIKNKVNDDFDLIIGCHNIFDNAELVRVYEKFGDIFCVIGLFSKAKDSYKKISSIFIEQAEKNRIEEREKRLPKFFFENSQFIESGSISSPEIRVDPDRVNDTEKLATYLREKTISKKNKEKLFEIANCIKEDLCGKCITEDMMAEIVPLSKIPNPNFNAQLIDIIIKYFSTWPLSMSQISAGLALMIRNSCIEAVQDTINFSQLIIKLTALLREAYTDKDYNKLLGLVQATSQVLDAILQVALEKELPIEMDKEDVIRHLEDILLKIRKGKWKCSEFVAAELEYQTRYAYAALVNIPTDRNRLNEILKIWPHIYSVIGTAVLISSAILHPDPGKFFSGFDFFYKREAHSMTRTFDKVINFIYIKNKWYKEWYAALKVIDSALENNRLDLFEFLARSSECRKKEPFLKSLCQRLERIATSTTNTEIAKNAIKFLADIVQDREFWGGSKYAAQSVADILERLGKIKSQDIKSYIEEVKNNMTRGSDFVLPSPTASCNRFVPFQSFILNEIPNNLLLKAKEKLDLHPEPSLEILTNSIKKISEDIYVKRTPAININDQYDSCDLEADIDDFLKSSNKEVLLLLGMTGSGKTTFISHFVQSLWEKYRSGKSEWIPIYLDLPLEQPSNNLISKYLGEKNFRRTQPEEWKDKQLVFILDGYDALEPESSTIYTRFGFNSWTQSKIVVISRPLHRRNYENEFLRYGARRNERNIQKQDLNLFSDEDIGIYIKKYRDHRPQRYENLPNSGDEDIYQSIKQSVSSKLLGNPILLKRVLKYFLERGTGKIQLYDELVNKWIRHIEKPLSNYSEVYRKLKNNGGFKIRLLRFSEELALAMYKNNDTTAPVMRTLEQKSEYAIFFTNEREYPKLLSLNAPLIYKEEGKEEYKFIDESLRDYFVARALWEPDLGPGGLTRDDNMEIDRLNGLILNSGSPVVELLAERAGQVDEFKDRLYNLLNSPRSRPRAAENARIILEQAGMALTWLPFLRYRILQCHIV